MPGIVNTYGDMEPRTAVKRLLKRGQHNMTVERFGMPRPIPKKSSKTISFRRYETFARATAPLNEGVPPEGQEITYTDITKTLQQYGDVVWITDVIKLTHEDSIFNETVDNMGEQAAETLEIIRIEDMKAGSNVYYAGGTVTARANVNMVVTNGDFLRIVRDLSRNKAKEISRIVSATAKIDTTPVSHAYFAMCSTDLEPDIEALPKFTPIEKYSDSNSAIPHEFGKSGRIRFVTSPLWEPWLQAATGVSSTSFLSNGIIPTSNSNPDVYPVIIVGQDSYGIVPLQGENAVVPAIVNPERKTTDKKIQLN